jgi:hypothetical protein
MNKTNEDFNKNWFVFDGQNVVGPLSDFDIRKSYESRRFLDTDLMWQKGFSEWKPIKNWLENQRRKHPRAPFLGEVKLHNGAFAKPLTISAGGIGIDFEDGGVSVGQKILMNISSPYFARTVFAEGVVVHHSDDRTGVQFTDVTADDHAIIQDYLDRFEK